jgi:hypothetical protein
MSLLTPEQLLELSLPSTNVEGVELIGIGDEDEDDIEEQAATVEAAEGLEVSIEDLLEEVLDKPYDQQSEHERKLQSLYKYHPYYLGIRDRIREAALLGKLIESGDVVACPTCGDIYRIGEWPLCGTSKANDRHGHVIKRNAKSDTCTTYFINQHTGKVWIPGNNKHDPRDKFGRPIKGYVKYEVRTFSDRDKFYKLMDGMAKKEYYGRLEREQKMFDPLLAENRKQARHDIMATEAKSPEASYGREMLARSMQRTEDAAHAKLKYEPNTALDSWEMNEGNRKDGPDPTFDVNVRQDIVQPILQERHKKLVGKGVGRKKVA